MKVECRDRSRVLVVILIFSGLARSALALYYGDWVPGNQDDISYSTLALRLATGHGYTFKSAWYPFIPTGVPTAHWSYLYTAFVAVMYVVVGFHPVVVRLVSAVLGGILLPWMAYRLARRLFPNRAWTPVVAALSTASYAYFIMFAARIMTETFFMVAVLWSLERAAALAGAFREEEQLGWSAALELGASLGLAALLRQAILPWVPVLFMWLLWQAWLGLRATEHPIRLNVTTLKRSNVQTLFLAGVVLLAFILPWTYRNYRVYDEFLLLNSNSGYAMYSAQHPMHGTDFQEHEAAPLPEDLVGQGLNEAQWDKELMRRGIGFVLDDPGRYLLLSLSRVPDYFEFWPTDTTLLHNAGRLVSFTLYLPFMIWGLFLGAQEAKKPIYGSDEPESRFTFYVSLLSHPVGLVYLFMFFYSAMHIFTWAMPRYRLPVDAAAMPFAALAFERTYNFIRGLFTGLRADGHCL
jgi:hypothetical protein